MDYNIAAINSNTDIAVINNSAEITLKIDEIVTRVQTKIANLKLNTISATEDNKKILKDIRSELNKEVQKYEKDIQNIDAFINQGLNELKKQYKEKIKTLYKLTDEQLKTKIDEITTLQLQEKKEYSLEYYKNKFSSMPLRAGVKYDDIPWDFKINSSKKSIRDACDAHFASVESALFIIDNHEYKTQLEELWIQQSYDIKSALVILQTQLTNAARFVRQVSEVTVRSAKPEVVQVEPEVAQVEPEKLQEEGPEIKMPEVKEITDYLFKIEATEDQLETLVDFLVDNRISFELIE